MLRRALFPFLCAPLIAVLPTAHAQKKPGESKDVPVLTITTARDPVDKSYRRMVLGMDLFEKNHHLAPQAPLRFKLLPRHKSTDMSRIGVEIAGDTFSIPVKVADDSTFALERIQKALDEDASVRSNRKALTMTWRAEIRSPGLPPDTRRLGDLRLECAVGMEADLVSNRFSALQRIADLFGATRNYCNRAKPRYFFFAERPVFGVTLVWGARREPVLIDMLYSGALDRPMTERELATCDCEVLLDRAFYLPLGDRSWPDDTRVEFEYMDDGRTTESDCTCRQRRCDSRARVDLDRQEHENRRAGSRGQAEGGALRQRLRSLGVPDHRPGEGESRGGQGAVEGRGGRAGARDGARSPVRSVGNSNEGPARPGRGVYGLA
jgi:hypothetical protein